APDAGERGCVQCRDDLLPEGDVERRVAEHRRDVDREGDEQARHDRRIVEQAGLQLAQRAQALGMHPAVEAPLQRRPRVLAEVEAVAAEHRLEQEVDLELLELRIRRRKQRVRAGWGCQWYSHTRIRDKSWSVSTGFVM